MRTLHRYTPEDVERLVRVNLLGVYNGLRARFRCMLAAGGGAIVNNASAQRDPARARRGALRRGEGGRDRAHAERRARVRPAHPGELGVAGDDPDARCRRASSARRALLDPVIAATPLGRTGSAEEVADAVVFLLSDQARFITGHDLVIDGGLGLPGAGIDQTIRGLLAKIERD